MGESPRVTPEWAVRFRELREARGLSQAALSFAMYDADSEEHRGYDPSFIARVERGERRPPYRFMVLVGRVLGPTIQEFPEYHLAMARRRLDEEEVGLSRALVHLDELGLASLDREVESARQALTRDAADVDEEHPRASETPRTKPGAREKKRGAA